MLPIDTNTGKAWSATSVKVAHDAICAGCLNDLRKRDAGFGIGEDGKVYYDPESEEGKPGRYVVDEEKARAKHTGGEYVALIRARWATFCGEPRDEAEFIKRHRLDDRTAKIAQFVGAAKDIEASIPADKPKRSPGRPRGSRNKSPEPLTPEPEPVAVTETTEAAIAGG